MKLPKLCGIAAISVVIWGGPSLADGPDGTTDACILERFETGAAPTDCIDAAHAACLSSSTEAHSVAALCFRDAQSRWNEGIKARLEAFTATASEEIAAIAAIEVKYDVLSGLLQCDRMQDLSLAVSQMTPEAILRQKSQCDATALGLAYARLLWRARTPE